MAVPSGAWCQQHCSPSRLVAPMTLAGRTALSVEMNTNRSAPTSAASSMTLSVPITLVVTASTTWVSRIGTCLCAAAWKTTSGRQRENTSANASRQRDVGQDLLALARRRGGHVVKVGLVVVQHDQDIGLGARHLPADLRADGASGPGHQDPAPLEGTAHRGQVRDHLAPPEQVLNPRLPGGAHGHRRRIGDGADELAQVGHDLHGDLRVLGGTQTSLHERGGRVGHGQQDLLDLELLDAERDVVDAPTTGTPMSERP